MNAITTTIQRPQRWDEPFGPKMNDTMVQQLLKREPFRSMVRESFSAAVPLDGLLLNDCRVVDLERGDIIMREGDYGNSAFLILDGEALVSLKSLSAEILGRQTAKKKTFFEALSQLWKNSTHPETRDYHSQGQSASQIGARAEGAETRIFLQDIPRIIGPNLSISLKPGEIFGEISALTRAPRSATIVANAKTRLLEIRWQGFRELLKRNGELRNHVEKLYRENSLKAHLREIDMFKNLASDTISQIAEATLFESYGDFQWNQNFKSAQQKDIAQRILAEPLIAQQGEKVDGVVLIRNGFARLSRRHGDGHQTIAYVSKGASFGFRELVHNWKTGDQRGWLLGLRAVGYVDVLRIPSKTMEKWVLPQLNDSQLPAPIEMERRVRPDELDLPFNRESSSDSKAGATSDTKADRSNNLSGQDDNRRNQSRGQQLDPGLMEFLVGGRFINGVQTMMIDLDRCTRCDDCVRACASTHNNNPRFIRHGPKYDHWMIANACMHCLDPVCMIGCPTGAIGRDKQSGNVMINDLTCIGCGTCANSCPYQNIRMVEVNDRRGKPLVDQAAGKPIVKATKCDLCVEQLGGPACQHACPHDALVRINLTDSKDITSWSQR